MHCRFLQFRPLQLAAVLLGGFLPAHSQAEVLPLNIQVRSEVDRPFKGFGREPERDYGKVYFIAYIKEAPGGVDLVRPVDEDEMQRILQAELTKRGYREATPADEPDIILTVHYGRGFLRNPYLNDVHMDEDTVPPTARIMGLQTHIVRQKTFRFEERSQAAQNEKLFIRVTAWANPAVQPAKKNGKQPKPKLLWKTTMVTDDPANRDLNQFVKKLLAAGSGFFNRNVEKEEAHIETDLPEGYVRYGDLKFLSNDDDVNSVAQPAKEK